VHVQFRQHDPHRLDRRAGGDVHDGVPFWFHRGRENHHDLFPDLDRRGWFGSSLGEWRARLQRGLLRRPCNLGGQRLFFESVPWGDLQRDL